MLNLIRMDLYRLIHSKVTWVMLIIVIGMGVFTTQMTDYDIEMMKKEMSAGTYVNDMEAGEVQPGNITVVPDEEWVSGRIESGSVVASQVESRIMLIFITVFTVLFVNAKQKNGYIKNVAGLFPRREKLVIAEALAVALQVLLMLAAFTLSILIYGKIIWGGGLYMGSYGTFMKFFAVQYALHLGVAMVIFFLCQLTRSGALSITIGILTSTGFPVLIYALINRGVAAINNSWGFDISRYMPEVNITGIGIDAGNGDMLRALTVAVAFMILFTGLAAFFMRKRDIR